MICREQPFGGDLSSLDLSDFEVSQQDRLLSHFQMMAANIAGNPHDPITPNADSRTVLLTAISTFAILSQARLALRNNDYVTRLSPGHSPLRSGPI